MLLEQHAGRRAEPIACWIIVAVGVYRIGQVVWALMCVDGEHHQCQLELDSVHHWQPWILVPNDLKNAEHLTERRWSLNIR